MIFVYLLPKQHGPLADSARSSLHTNGTVKDHYSLLLACICVINKRDRLREPIELTQQLTDYTTNEPFSDTEATM